MQKRFPISASGYCGNRLEKIHICVSASALMICALSLLIVPLNWVLSWCIAVLVHEMCHFIALKLQHVSVPEVRISWKGVLMLTGPMSAVQELVSVLAGPLGGLTLVYFGRFFPRLGVCALLQNLFNLMPVQSMDGGRIVRAALILCLGEERGSAASIAFQRVFWVLAILILLVLSLRIGVAALPAALLLLLRTRQSKISLQRDESNCTI